LKDSFRNPKRPSGKPDGLFFLARLLLPGSFFETVKLYSFNESLAGAGC
jgi:hypothetical protein